MSLRDYQQEAIDSTYSWLVNHPGEHCVVCIPTGGGKTPILAKLCHDASMQFKQRVLVIAHVKELLDQADKTLLRWYPDLDVGVYSAGLHRRELGKPITIAGIQSVYNKAEQIGHVGLVLIDEAHRVRLDEDGMYRTLIAELQAINPKLRIVGLTATPYRLDGGMIFGEGRLFSGLSYEAGLLRLINQNYLCPIKGKASIANPDLEGVAVSKGEYVESELESAFGLVVEQAVDELIGLTADRKSIIVFCCGVGHASTVAALLDEKATGAVRLVTGSTSDEKRASYIDGFKKGQIRWLVNVNVLCEGFDAPGVDCVAVMRATLSPGLYYQMAGRGLRLSQSKKDCLLLDFGQNAQRHGMLDKIQPTRRTLGAGKSEKDNAPQSKACDKCRALNYISAKTCSECGEPFPVKHEAGVSLGAVISTEEKPERREIQSATYKQHPGKSGKPPTLRVDYFDLLGHVCSEFICLEHEGFAKHKARDWWKLRYQMDYVPATIEEALELSSQLKPVEAIWTVQDGKYKRVVRAELKEFSEEEVPF